MKCPNDQTVLAMTERNGVEIDYCPTCRGVWLDRGELDKLIASGESSVTKHPTHDSPPRKDERSQNSSHDFNHHNRKHRKESFLGDIFDF